MNIWVHLVSAGDLRPLHCSSARSVHLLDYCLNCVEDELRCLLDLWFDGAVVNKCLLCLPVHLLTSFLCVSLHLMFSQGYSQLCLQQKKNMQKFCFIIGGFSLREKSLKVNGVYLVWRFSFVITDFSLKVTSL